MSDATPPAGFGRPDPTAFARLDGLGLSVIGQRLEPDRAVLACRVVEPDQWCRRCGSEGAARDTANNAVLAEGKRLLINDPTRFEGVKVIGVDEHVWRHTRRGDKYVTVIIDLTPVRDGAGPARLLDMVEGRSKAAFKTWLADRDDAFRDAVEVVAMDGRAGVRAVR